MTEEAENVQNNSPHINLNRHIIWRSSPFFRMLLDCSGHPGNDLVLNSHFDRWPSVEVFIKDSHPYCLSFTLNLYLYHQLRFGKMTNQPFPSLPHHPLQAHHTRPAMTTFHWKAACIGLILPAEALSHPHSVRGYISSYALHLSDAFPTAFLFTLAAIVELGKGKSLARYIWKCDCVRMMLQLAQTIWILKLSVKEETMDQRLTALKWGR